VLIASFRARYPEFSNASDSLVVSCLNEAEMELVANADWGNRFDTAHGLLTADKLWSSPFGATMRLDDAGKVMASSRYAKQLGELHVKTFPKILVT
jgi:hypothetical protein